MIAFQDLNDNGPEFQKKEYNFVVKESIQGRLCKFFCKFTLNVFPLRRGGGLVMGAGYLIKYEKEKSHISTQCLYSITFHTSFRLKMAFVRCMYVQYILTLTDGHVDVYCRKSHSLCLP